MKHRYIIWTGHRKNRHFFIEVHIIDGHDDPICQATKGADAESENIYRARPDGLPLCKYCRTALPAFEDTEKLRTWTANAGTP